MDIYSYTVFRVTALYCAQWAKVLMHDAAPMSKYEGTDARTTQLQCDSGATLT